LSIACGTETGNGLVTVKAGLSANSSVDPQGTVLTLETAEAVIDYFDFVDVKRIEGPYIVDLIDRTATPSLAGIDLPAGNYPRVDARFSSDPKLLGHNTLVASGLIAYPAGSSTPFDLTLKFEETAMFELSGGIDIEEGAVEDILMDLDAATWFASLPITQCLDEGELAIENGRIRIADKGQRCKDIEKTLKDVIRNSGRLRED
jgi:hypothetical protein